MSLFGINASMSAVRAQRAWPHWFAPSTAAEIMRGSLSSSLSYARCANPLCNLRRSCRYEIQTDRFFCSEECFGTFYEEEFRARGLIPTLSPPGAGPR